MMVCPPAWAACSRLWTSSLTLKYLDTHLRRQGKSGGRGSQPREASGPVGRPRPKASPTKPAGCARRRSPVDADGLALVEVGVGVPGRDAFGVARLDNPPEQVRHGLELHGRLGEAGLVGLAGRGTAGSAAEEGGHGFEGVGKGGVEWEWEGWATRAVMDEGEGQLGPKPGARGKAVEREGTDFWEGGNCEGKAWVSRALGERQFGLECVQ